MRNAALEKHLDDDQLISTDVKGDGSCFYWAVSLSINGHPDGHVDLRRAVANYFVSQSNSSSSPEDVIAVRQYAAEILREDKWAGEDIIMAMANCLRRDICVYMYVGVGGTSPNVYSPHLADGEQLRGPPVLVAFYEPGHYRYVSKRPSISIIPASATTFNLNVQGR